MTGSAAEGSVCSAAALAPIVELATGRADKGKELQGTTPFVGAMLESAPVDPVDCIGDVVSAGRAGPEAAVEGSERSAGDAVPVSLEEDTEPIGVAIAAAGLPGLRGFAGGISRAPPPLPKTQVAAVGWLLWLAPRANSSGTAGTEGVLQANGSVEAAEPAGPAAMVSAANAGNEDFVSGLCDAGLVSKPVLGLSGG